MCHCLHYFLFPCCSVSPLQAKESNLMDHNCINCYFLEIIKLNKEKQLKLHTISSTARRRDMFKKLELISFEYIVASWSWFMKFLSKGITLADRYKWNECQTRTEKKFHLAQYIYGIPVCASIRGKCYWSCSIS